MLPKKGTTGIVAYIAVLMIAGASLGHQDGGTSFGNFRTSAISYSDGFSAPREQPRTKEITVSIDGRSYRAVLISELETPGTSPFIQTY